MKKTTDKAILQAAETAHESELKERDAKREKEAARAAILAKMDALGVDELQAGEYVIKRSTSKRSSLDTKRLKQERPDVANAYTKQSTVHHFAIDKH